MRKQKGITLIVLVITIIILIILAGVSIRVLLGHEGIINKTKETKTQVEIASIKEEIKTDMLAKQIENKGDISEDNIKEILEKHGILSEEEKLTDKTLTTKKGNHEIKVSDILNTITENDVPKEPIITDKSGADAPDMSKIEKKTYVTWDLNEEGTEYIINDTQTTQPDYWYDYENGKWANIKTTQINEKEDGTKEILEAYWVWIPRYEYIVPISEIATEIQVRFIGTDKREGTEGYTKQSDGTIKSSDGYTIHPAFTWNERQEDGTYIARELEGIWVAKFEASSNTSTPDTNYGGGNDINLKVQVKPGVQSWRSITSNNMFLVCRKMGEAGEVLDGLNIDSHLMKNMEWGAVTILSQSKYGIFNSQSNIENPTTGERRIWNNPNGYNSGKYVYTGYTGDNPDALTENASEVAPTNVYAYNTKNGTKGSTTGTVYGIYDMAGGCWEYVAACLNEQENAKFGEIIGNFEYIDLYNNPSNLSENYDGAKVGDATKETKGWNGEYAEFIRLASPVFARGR